AFDGANALLADQPDRADYRELRGMAAYRLGRSDEVLADPGPEAEIGAVATDGGRQYAAFLAMAELRTGGVDSARRRIANLRNHLADGATPAKETVNLVEEAEALLSAERNDD